MFNISTEIIPPFYATYWIIAIAVIAIVHEFSHGVFSRHANVKVKSTGFGFLGPFLAAFVEPDEKQLSKKSKKAQLAMFSAGSFANIITAIVLVLIFQGFFVSAYAPVGVRYDYFYTGVNVTDIEEINGVPIMSSEEAIQELNRLNSSLIPSDDKIRVTTSEKTYWVFVFNQSDPIAKTFPRSDLTNKTITIALYEDAPAIRANLIKGGAIKAVNENKVVNIQELLREINKHSPGDIINVETITGNYEIKLDKNPQNKSRPFIGLAFTQASGFSKFMGFFGKPISQQRHPSTVYEPKSNHQFTIFIYNLLFWLVLINFFVALFNMLPVAVLDGGRVFYLTIFAATKSKRKSEVGLKIATFLILLYFIALMFVWASGVGL